MTDTKTRAGSRPKTPRRPLSDIAYEDIKWRIIQLEFEPGTYLNEAQLSDLLSLGRTPIHQAVQRLTHEGLLEIIPRKGLIVKPINFKEVLDIIEIRLLNEGLCARLAAQRISDQQLDRLDKILQKAQDMQDNGDIAVQMTLDREFHQHIAQAASNQVLGDLLRNLHERSLRVWFVSLNNRRHASKVQEEHHDIIEALRLRDQDAAETAMRAHILAFKHNILKAQQ